TATSQRRQQHSTIFNALLRTPGTLASRKVCMVEIQSSPPGLSPCINEDSNLYKQTEITTAAGKPVQAFQAHRTYQHIARTELYGFLLALPFALQYASHPSPRGGQDGF